MAEHAVRRRHGVPASLRWSSHCALARRLAEGLRDAGIEVLNRVVLNQVLARLDHDAATDAVREADAASSETWFGPGLWEGRRAFRLSVSLADPRVGCDRTIALLARLARNVRG